ncbi:MAG: serine/threonine-protein kinase [Planctomycetota bacterium]
MNPTLTKHRLRVGSRLGKYRLNRRIASGGFATVFAATDTLLGMPVALKVVSADLVDEVLLDQFRREVRLTIGLEHPGILPVRDTGFESGHLFMASPLASKTLSDRLEKRFGFETAFDYASQILSAVAFAHENSVIHCDIKPENILLFDDGVLRLADFGIAKVAMTTASGSGTGTIGYMAPDQAMGKPSMRSDVFSIDLILYRMFSGHWPEYAFDWPPAGAANLRRRLHRDSIHVIKKSIEVRPRDRFADASAMGSAWEATRSKALRFAKRQRSR